MLNGLVSIRDAPGDAVHAEFWTTFMSFMHTQSLEDEPNVLLGNWSTTDQGKQAPEDVQEFVETIVQWMQAGSLPLSVLPLLKRYFSTDDDYTRTDLREAVIQAIAHNTGATSGDEEHDEDADADAEGVSDID